MLSMMMPLAPPATGRAWLGRGLPFLQWRSESTVIPPMTVFHTGEVIPEWTPVFMVHSRLLLLSMIREPKFQNALACQAGGVIGVKNPALVQVTAPSAVSFPQLSSQEGAPPPFDRPAVATTYQK